MERELILALGGARSGKSDVAEALARTGGRRVLYVATAEAHDEEMEARIATHRRRRPAVWDTLEEPLDLAERISDAIPGHDTVLLDCLTLWVSNLLLRHGEGPGAEAHVVDRLDAMLRVYEESSARWIVVSGEVGLGIVPPSSLGRAYRDILGRVNRIVAERARHAYLVVAGIAVDLKAIGIFSVDVDKAGD